MPVYLQLFLSFAYIGMFTFGGGYSMLPMLRRELTEKRKWLTDSEIADMFAAAQCLPGIIACNTAVFAGNKIKGVPGGIAAALGVVFPSIVIITLIAAFLSGFNDNPYVISALAGVRVCVCVLILNTVVRMREKSVVDIPSAAIFATVALAAVFTSINIAILVVSAGVLGAAASMLRKRRKAGK